MNLADIIELALLLTALLPLTLSFLRRYAAANHNDYWARILGGLERVSAEIGEALQTLPAGADLRAVRQALVAQAVKEAQAEFDTSIAKTGVSPERLAVTLDRMVAARLLPGLQAAAGVAPAPQPIAPPAA